MIRDTFYAAAVSLAILAAGVTAAPAQDTAVVPVETSDEGFDWGWLGLLGLIGLAGLRGRKRDDRHDTTATRSRA